MVAAGYVIGVEDILTVIFLRDKDLSAEVVVRPDGKISLPLLNDLHAAGLTPEQLSGVVEQSRPKSLVMGRDRHRQRHPQPQSARHRQGYPTGGVPARERDDRPAGDRASGQVSRCR